MNAELKLISLLAASVLIAAVGGPSHGDDESQSESASSKLAEIKSLASDQRSTSLVNVKRSPSQSKILQQQWDELPEGLRKRIESEIVVGRLGLSSTGRVELIGVYTQGRGRDDDKKPQRHFHLLQQDLFGSRLFWSTLINPDDATYKVLYHVNEPGEASSWRKLRGG
jgi:hypothetical protein